MPITTRAKRNSAPPVLARPRTNVVDGIAATAVTAQPVATPGTNAAGDGNATATVAAPRAAAAQATVAPPRAPVQGGSQSATARKLAA